MDDFFDTPGPADVTKPEVNSVEVELAGGKSVVVEETSRSYETAKMLAGKKSEIAALHASIGEQEDRKKALRAKIDELQEAKNALAEQVRILDEEMFDAKRQIRQLNNEVFNLQRVLAQELDAEMSAKKFLENKVEFNKVMEAQPYAAKILDHQRDGAYILATNMRTILGDKRGAGKTLTAIAAWDMAQCQRVLVIVPDDVVSNFVNEIHYWAPHRNVMQVGKMPPAQRQFAINLMRNMESFTCVVNYSAWRKDKSLITDLVSLRFDTVVMDEAHEIKNTSTSAYKGCRDIVLAENCCPRCSSEVVNVNTVDGWSNYWQCTICPWNSQDDRDYEFLDHCSVKMVIPMSGTVILNKPQDLFALLSLVDPINFAELKDFLRIYCQQNWYTSKWEFKSGGLESLQKKLSGKYIARPGVKTPGQKVYTHDIEIDPTEYPKQHRIIEQLTKHAQILMDSGKKHNSLFTIELITRKRQANVWPAGIKIKDPETGDIVFTVGEEIDESIKVDKMLKYNRFTDEWEGMLWDMTEGGNKELGDRVVVFSQFKGGLQELERRCKDAGISAVRFDGDTRQTIKDEAKIDFDRKYCETPEYGEYKWQVILANYKTGGVGLNFTAATETIIMDREWNPGKEDQAFGRTDRLGQTEETNVHILRLARTIDVWMDEVINEKSKLIAGFNEVGEDLSSRLLKAMQNGDMI